jgi:tRNA1Val (adenine37-N6)-methyltransferase
MNDSFAFRQFEIKQDRCAMKVGTDGVLLGAWARGGNRILDVGCGTGLIALMMAQRFPEACVEGVEIHQQAALQAHENAVASPFGNRVVVHGVSLQEFVPEACFEAIVSNPPFFLHGLKNPDDSRTLARHADSLPFGDIFNFAARWLVPQGELSLIVPVEVLENVITDAYLSGFYISRKVMLKTTLRKPFRRCLIAFVKERSGTLETAERHLQESDGSRSEWYQNMTKDFYLW